MGKDGDSKQTLSKGPKNMKMIGVSSSLELVLINPDVRKIPSANIFVLFSHIRFGQASSIMFDTQDRDLLHIGSLSP